MNDVARTAWTDEQRELLRNDPVLHATTTEWLDALLTAEERDAMQQHLSYLANLRRRVEAESRNEPMR